MKNWIAWSLALMGCLTGANASGQGEPHLLVVGEDKQVEEPGFTPHFHQIFRLGETSGFEVDREGNRFEPGLTLQNRFRVGLDYDSGLQWDFLVF